MTGETRFSYTGKFFLSHLFHFYLFIFKSNYLLNGQNLADAVSHLQFYIVGGMSLASHTENDTLN